MVIREYHIDSPRIFHSPKPYFGPFTNDDEQEGNSIGSSWVPWVASIIVGGTQALTAWSGSGARERSVAGDNVLVAGHDVLLGVGNGVTGGLF
jgi:hypothetical protein